MLKDKVIEMAKAVNYVAKDDKDGIVSLFSVAPEPKEVSFMAYKQTTIVDDRRVYRIVRESPVCGYDSRKPTYLLESWEDAYDFIANGNLN